MTWLGVLLVLAAAGVAVARLRYQVITVAGSSMTPTFHDGDRLLIRRTRTVERGTALVFAPPGQPFPSDPPWLVKRATATSGDPVPPEMAAAVRVAVVPDGYVAVLGDNPHSLDSRRFGLVPVTVVLGVVVRRLSS